MKSFFTHTFEVRPRYKFLVDSSVMLKFSGPEYVPWEEQGTVLFVNLSGAAIALPELLAPLKNELVEISYTIEDTEVVQSRLAKVVHLQLLSDGFVGMVVQYLVANLSEKLELSQALNKIQKEKKDVKSHNRASDLSGSDLMTSNASGSKKSIMGSAMSSITNSITSNSLGDNQFSNLSQNKIILGFWEYLEKRNKKRSFVMGVILFVLWSVLLAVFYSLR